MDLNKAMVIGRLTRDPEVRSTSTGQTVANFAVATNHVWKDASGQKQERPEYHDVVVWGKLAEIVSQYLTKGRRVYVEGRLQTRDWTGNDGIRRYKTEIIANDMIMLDGNTSGGGNFSGSSDDFGGGAPMNVPEPSVQDDEIKVEDIPF